MFEAVDLRQSYGDVIDSGGPEPQMAKLEQAFQTDALVLRVARLGQPWMAREMPMTSAEAHVFHRVSHPSGDSLRNVPFDLSDPFDQGPASELQAAFATTRTRYDGLTP